MLKNLTMNSQQYCTFMSFPFKLHQMLSEAEKDGKESIVSWLPNGEAFKVHKKDKFVDEISKYIYGSCILLLIPMESRY